MSEINIKSLHDNVTSMAISVYMCMYVIHVHLILVFGCNMAISAYVYMYVIHVHLILVLDCVEKAQSAVREADSELIISSLMDEMLNRQVCDHDHKACNCFVGCNRNLHIYLTKEEKEEVYSKAPGIVGLFYCFTRCVITAKLLIIFTSFYL